MDKRTIKQNSSLHVGFELLADALNNAGYETKAVLAVKQVEVPWNESLVKELLYRPIMLAMFNKQSTTELDTKEISDVWDVLQRHLGEHFGVNLPFPSDEEQMLETQTE